MSVEYAGAGGLAPLRQLAKATGNELEYVVRLANRGELRRLFPAGKKVTIGTPPESDTPPITATSPRLAQLALQRKRFGPSS